jgi:hypothetical protein
VTEYTYITKVYRNYGRRKAFMWKRHLFYCELTN